MNNLHIAIVGAGIAGLSVACFLRQHGHTVTLFEKFAKPQPMGSGLLLQPTGLAVLSMLRLQDHPLDDLARKTGVMITRLDGQTIRTGKKVFSLAVQEKDPLRYCSVGMHRHALFSLLLETAQAANVVLQCDSTITDIRLHEMGKTCTVHTKDGAAYDAFDLVIDASGIHSALRTRYADIQRHFAYPYGALWGTFIDQDRHFARQGALQQRYDGTKKMMGLLPVGAANLAQDASFVSLFWNLKKECYASWREEAALDLPAFQEKLCVFWPAAEPVVRQMQTADDLVLATYADIRLRSCFHLPKRLVFIGDAAHCTSPQLGQGANLALMDGAILAHALKACGSLEEACTAFAQRRKAHVGFYQTASAWLTPFFQSDSLFYGWLRDACFPLFHKVPFLRRQMIETLLGSKTGPFSSMPLAKFFNEKEITA